MYSLCVRSFCGWFNSDKRWFCTDTRPVTLQIYMPKKFGCQQFTSYVSELPKCFSLASANKREIWRFDYSTRPELGHRNYCWNPRPGNANPLFKKFSTKTSLFFKIEPNRLWFLLIDDEKSLRWKLWFGQKQCDLLGGFILRFQNPLYLEIWDARNWESARLLV